MDFNSGYDSWDFSPAPQDNPQPMPDNINWGNVLGQVGDAMNNGATYVNFTQPPPWQTMADTAADALSFGTSWLGWQNAPQYVDPGPPMPWWARNSDKGKDPGFRTPEPTSPNDMQFKGTPSTDFNLPSHRYDSYWTPTPPAPPDPEFTPLGNFQQQLWQGVAGYQYNQPQFKQGQETPPLIKPNLPPVPFGQSW